MFTLIAIGVGAAWIYSVVAVLAPHLAWLYAHGFPTFSYAAAHEAPGFADNLRDTLSYFAGSVGYASVALLAAWLLLRPSRAALADLADCDLVIEAIAELPEVKHELFAELGRLAKADAVLATNTSAISVTGIAEASGRPDRVVGLHFFNPAPVLPLERSWFRFPMNTPRPMTFLKPAISRPV